jgi:hypothetical protein
MRKEKDLEHFRGSGKHGNALEASGQRARRNRETEMAEKRQGLAALHAIDRTVGPGVPESAVAGKPFARLNGAPRRLSACHTMQSAIVGNRGGNVTWKRPGNR